MGKIRVQDIAQRIGMEDQDLIFKLRSIGVRVEGKDALVDTEVLKAILEGKRLQTPREVIVRDEESEGKAPRPPRGRHRRPPGRPRPSRPRTVIQKVDKGVKTIPSKKKKEEPSEKPEKVAAEAAEEAVETKEVAAEARSKGKARRKAEVEAEERAAKEAAEKEAAAVRKAAKERRDRRKEAARSDEAARAIADEKGMITIVEGMTVRDFSEKLGLKSKDVIKKLFERKIVANINHVLDTEVALELAEDLGYDASIVSFEEEVRRQQEEAIVEREKTEGDVPRAPVVTIMGHVDHGKTTLLDAIRQSRVVESEHGGITQHIGAYRVEKNDRKIVFLDTPGHEAFTQLRARGASATDIVVLVVAADDGVMPQTVEAIDHARAAEVPIVVAVNKMDKANANPDKVKTELSDLGLMPEEWGGETVTVGLSALQGEGIDELLEMILLTSDLLELEANPELPASGVVLEARKEVGRGIVSTVLVQNGSVSVGDVFVTGATWGRVRSMTNDLGERIETAGPSTPVEITGFQDVPDAGDLFQAVEDETKGRSIADYRQQEQRRRELAPSQGKISLDQLFSKIEEGEVKELPVVVKADVQGSVEVLTETLEKLGTEKVKVKVIHAGVGAVSTNNVLLASASDAIVIGFNIRPERNASELAEKEGVEIRLYTVIYELTDDIKKAMTGLLEPTFKEVQTGAAEVRDTFSVPKAGTVAGCHVIEGVIPRNAEARLLRDNVVIYEGRIASLRRFKDDVSEVRTGFDCGIGLERFNDIKIGDIIEAFVREEVAPTL